MIGSVCISAFKYYDSAKHRMAFKGRPVLVIGQADNSGQERRSTGEKSPVFLFLQRLNLCKMY